jgi:hypothetical protein
MICLLNEQAYVVPCFVGIRFAIPIFKVTLVEPTPCQEVDDIHEKLLICVLNVCNDCNFLAVGTPLEKDLERVLRIVIGKTCGHVLSDCVGNRATIGLHELVKNLDE